MPDEPTAAVRPVSASPQPGGTAAGSGIAKSNRLAAAPDAEHWSQWPMPETDEWRSTKPASPTADACSPAKQAAKTAHAASDASTRCSTPKLAQRITEPNSALQTSVDWKAALKTEIEEKLRALPERAETDSPASSQRVQPKMSPGRGLTPRSPQSPPQGSKSPRQSRTQRPASAPNAGRKVQVNDVLAIADRQPPQVGLQILGQQMGPTQKGQTKWKTQRAAVVPRTLKPKQCRPSSAPHGPGKRVNPHGRGLHSTIWEGAPHFPDSMISTQRKDHPNFRLHAEEWDKTRGLGSAKDKYALNFGFTQPV